MPGPILLRPWRLLWLLAVLPLVLAGGLGPLLWPGPAEAAVSIVRVTVSNVDDSSFTVSWVTNVPSDGHVLYGTAPGELSGRADDFRGPDYVGYTHYVTVSGLLVDTTYYYAVVSGDTTGATVYNVKTGQTLTTIPDPAANFFFGTVSKSDGVTPAEGVIVVVYVARLVNPGTAPQSTKLSAVTDHNGEFNIDVSQARTTTLPQTYFTYSLYGDRVYYQVDGGWNNPPTSIPGSSGGWLWEDTNTTSEGDNPTDVRVTLPNPDLPTPTRTATATVTPTPAPTNCTTTVGGAVEGSVIWTLTGSPYCAAASIAIGTGATLTIEPGVVVRLGAVKGIRVDGTLVARGTPEQPIVFTSDSAAPRRGEWGSIHFTDSSADAVYDGAGNWIGGSVLQHVVVDYAGGPAASSPGAVRVESSSPLIDRSVVRNSGGSAIQVSGAASPRISGNGLYGNGLYGNGRGIFASTSAGGQVTIRDNSVRSNSTDGIWVAGAATISGNSIGANYGHGVYVSEGAVTIGGNSVDGNSGNGIYMLSGAVTIDGNTVSGNAGSGIYVTSGSAGIIGNTVSGNTGGGLRLAGCASSTSVTGNGLLGNSAGGGLYVGTNCRPTITSNNIVGNVAGSPASANDLTIGSTDVTAEGNWWGTADPAQVAERVWDFFDDSALGIVDYTPYLTAPADLPISPTPTPTGSPAPATATPTPTPTRTPGPTLTPTPTITPIAWPPGTVVHYVWLPVLRR